MAFLVLPGGQRIEARDGVKIGRAPDCEVVVHDVKASRHHAALRVEGTVAEIEDLGSHNGTLLNGQPVRRRLLRHGDRIGIGLTELRYEEGAAPAAPAPAAELVLDDPYRPGGGLEGDPLHGDPPRAAPAPQELEVLEFVDEVVAVRKPAAGVPAPAARPTVAPRAAGVLQFAQRARGGGMLRDDLRQMPAWMRGSLLLAALLAAAALGWLAMRFVKG